MKLRGNMGARARAQGAIFFVWAKFQPYSVVASSKRCSRVHGQSPWLECQGGLFETLTF